MRDRLPRRLRRDLDDLDARYEAAIADAPPNRPARTSASAACHGELSIPGSLDSSLEDTASPDHRPCQLVRQLSDADQDG